MPDSAGTVCKTYLQDSDPAWTAQAALTFEVAGYPDVVRPLLLTVTGPCPRCAGPVVVDHPTFAVAGVGPISREDVDRLDDEARGALPDATLPCQFVVECNCDRLHRLPDGTDRAGCGAAWWTRVEPLAQSEGAGDG